MLKRLRPLLTVLGVICFSICLAQAPKEKVSYYGLVHTPKGNLHILVIFVHFIEFDSYAENKNGAPELWPDGEIPFWARGSSNQLFDEDTSTIGETKNLSLFYREMSGGKFTVTAEVFPVSVPVKYDKGGFFQRQVKMNSEAIDWINKNYPDYDWSRFDNRTNRPNFLYDNSASKPDSVIDYVVFIYRDFGATGMASLGINKKVGTKGYRISSSDGHTGVYSYPDPEHQWLYFRHEFAHNLYGAEHYCGANNAAYNKFYVQKGWGMMEAWHGAFDVANAWECWWLDWLNAQTITEDGTYTIKDFLTQRDAVRIPIPGTNDTYLWIENHQKKDKYHFDDKLFYHPPESATGLYMYITKGGHDFHAVNSATPNFIKMLNGEGNFDYAWDSTKMFVKGVSEYIGEQPVFQKIMSNPVSGQNNFQFLRMDFNHDGEISLNTGDGNPGSGGQKRNEHREVWAELMNGIPSATYSNTGNENSAFVVGDEIGLSGIVPALNYPIYDLQQKKNSPYYPNGLSVKIISQNSDGGFTINVNLNDWNVRTSQRWCGEIVLPEMKNNSLTIEPNVKIILDKSGTPNRDTEVTPGSRDFVNPTVFTCVSGSSMILKNKSSLIVDRVSTLKLESDSQFIIQSGAKIIIRNDSKFIVDDESEFMVEANTQIIILSGGELKISKTDFQKIRPFVKVKRGGKITLL